MREGIINKVINPLRAPLGVWASDFAGLFVPRICAGCDTPLLHAERCLCLACERDLPLTRFHDDPRNPVEQLFWGRVELQAASAYMRFSRDGKVQGMLHRLKYQHAEDVGRELGRLMARDLMTCERFATVDTYMAVPLHPRKQRRRGYNQSQVLVDGMCEVWPKPSVGNGIVRVVRTPSQTKRGRWDRWLNVKVAFHLPDPESLRDRHVLLVDDVVTTGATIEGCVKALAPVPGIRISLFTAAYA
jgi:ComF family protein